MDKSREPSIMSRNSARENGPHVQHTHTHTRLWLFIRFKVTRDKVMTYTSLTRASQTSLKIGARQRAIRFLFFLSLNV